MSRAGDIQKLIEYDHDRHYLIDPEARRIALHNHVLDVVKTYSPAVIVKAGLGSGELVKELARTSDSYIVVVEQSLSLLEAFQAGLDDAMRERIRLIAGDYYMFPVDYFAADLLICTDMLSFIDSARAVDEFRRALQFDGILFLSSVVLNEDDVDGRYDEFMHSVLPLHNDYYIQDDLKTFIGLNEFNFVKGSSMSFPRDLAELSSYFAPFRDGDAPDPAAGLEAFRGDFERFYSLSGSIIAEPYFIGVFMRIKPPSELKR